MLSKKSFGIAGAAMLGTVALLGTNAAYAVIDLDAEDKSDPAATYAKETIIASVKGEDDRTYYRVDSNTDGVLNVEGEVGVGGTVDSVLIIQYVLEGMVFTKTSAPAMQIGSTNCNSASPSGDEATKRGGGDEGENTVSFIFTVQTVISMTRRVHVWCSQMLPYRLILADRSS